MRLWSLHPKYLDSKGLVALWREALLAKNVLEGKTRGYKNHPQLNRFKESGQAVGCINQYLEGVYNESVKRRYVFDRTKIDSYAQTHILTVGNKQIEYELQHLLRKLKVRDIAAYTVLVPQKDIEAHPLFRIIKGDIEEWEIL